MNYLDRINFLPLVLCSRNTLLEDNLKNTVSTIFDIRYFINFRNAYPLFLLWESKFCATILGAHNSFSPIDQNARKPLSHGIVLVIYWQYIRQLLVLFRTVSSQQKDQRTITKVKFVKPPNMSYCHTIIYRFVLLRTTKSS